MRALGVAMDTSFTRMNTEPPSPLRRRMEGWGGLGVSARVWFGRHSACRVGVTQGRAGREEETFCGWHQKPAGGVAQGSPIGITPDLP
jgi:hypothetical protein